MAKSINLVLIMGNLTKAPDVKMTTSGNTVAKFSLALNRSYKDRDGNWQEATDYVDIVAWGNLAEQVHERLDKGSRALVEGSLNTLSWQDKESGANRSKLEVLAKNVTFLDKTNIDVTVE